jgi:hypothetical protein
MPELVSPRWEVKQPAISRTALSGLNTLRLNSAWWPALSPATCTARQVCTIVTQIHDRRKQRIVEVIDLKTLHLINARLRDSEIEGRVSCNQRLSLSISCASPLGLKPKKVHLAASESIQSQEFYMSARNGDKSRFHRVRKQKIARRKRIQELLKRPANARMSVGAQLRQPRELS